MISIVVPVYNAAKYIEQTVSMVQKQTYSDWELILVEDCSKDKSREVLQKLEKEWNDSRIHVIYKEKNEMKLSEVKEIFSVLQLNLFSTKMEWKFIGVSKKTVFGFKVYSLPSIMCIPFPQKNISISK